MDSTLDYDKIIGYILSMLFGLVFKDVLTNFSKIHAVLMQYHQCKLSYLTSLLAAGVYCANMFRMLHGYIISIYDTKRNPTSFGPYPFGFREMVILVGVFIVPFISEDVIKSQRGPLPNLQLIFFLYQLPSLAYIIWDATLFVKLKRFLIDEHKEADTQLAIEYLKFVKVWFIVDVLNFAAWIGMVISLEVFDISVYYYPILFIFTLINITTFVLDYVGLNHNFYFKKQENAT